MRKALGRGSLLILAGAVAYLALWPVPVEPSAWTPSEDPGYTGAFAANTALAGLERIDTLGSGPEDLAILGDRLYTTAEDGQILRTDPGRTKLEPWRKTEGRPLGLAFDAQGTLWVADTHLGLVRISAGASQVVCNAVDGISIRFADGVDVAADGRVFFSDASTHFGVKANGGTLPASLLTIVEHSGDGRLLVYDPAKGRCEKVLDGLQFPNGVAVAPDQSFVAIVETSAYRVLKYHLTGPEAGQTSVLIGGLPGFPDNIRATADGHFWIGLFAPRARPIDLLAGWPRLRKTLLRLPETVRPKAQPYGHLIKVDAQGAVVANLQDPAGGYPSTTGAVELGGKLYVSSLQTPAIGVMNAP